MLTIFNTHSKEQCWLQSDATTGWNLATTPDSRLLKQLLTHSLASSIKNSKDHTTALKDYRTPQQNAAAVADKIKAARLAAVQQVAALEAKFGKEGAAEAIRIARMPQTHNSHRHQVRTVLVQPVACNVEATLNVTRCCNTAVNTQSYGNAHANTLLGGCDMHMLCFCAGKQARFGGSS